MQQLERYGHGGDLRTATEQYGIPEENWLDFSSNMNPWGPPEVVFKIMRDRWREIIRYPDPAVRGLRAKLADKYSIPAESILVGNGAAELIDLVIRVLNPSETILARPSFSEYEEAVEKVGGRIRELPLDAEHGFLLQAANTAEVSENRYLFLGHPNNPTGRLIPSETLQSLEDSGAGMILDEAFMDFVPDEENHSYIRKAAKSERVIVIRSMTKFYAVPGIRLGFMVAHPRLIERLSAVQTQWSVNFLAQLIGEAALDDNDYAKRTVAWLQKEKLYLIDKLGGLGLSVVPSDVNFLLVSLPRNIGWDVRRLQRAMAERGIMIRDASLFKGLDQSYFRVAVRLREDNEKLIAALTSILESTP